MYHGDSRMTFLNLAAYLYKDFDFGASTCINMFPCETVRLLESDKMQGMRGRNP